ncbi:MAG: hypothetical protein MRY83_10990 [Flavobacteriales bacterium]|nr:hypothetical protein [Flavobacteriales bacterium]
MNKLIFLALILLGTSCKKVYQCECTWNSGGNAGQVQTLQTAEKVSKSDAEDWCNENQEGISYADGTCTLK